MRISRRDQGSPFVKIVLGSFFYIILFLIVLFLLFFVGAVMLLLLLLAAAAGGAGARSSLLGMTQKTINFRGIPHTNGNIGNHEITITKFP